MASSPNNSCRIYSTSFRYQIFKASKLIKWARNDVTYFVYHYYGILKTATGSKLQILKLIHRFITHQKMRTFTKPAVANINN